MTAPSSVLLLRHVQVTFCLQLLIACAPSRHVGLSSSSGYASGSVFRPRNSRSLGRRRVAVTAASAMSPILASYDIPPPYRSAATKIHAESVPPTDELEKLQADLQELRQRSLARAKKAGEDLRIIEESMRRLKEKEKGKARASDKVKRERGCACYFLHLNASH